jgi:hypothetical protein
MNSLLSSVHDLPGADGEHAAELASCVCFPSIVDTSGMGLLDEKPG